MKTAANEFIMAYNAALTGNLNPDLLSAPNLYHLLQTHPDLQRTVYQSDPSIIYEFGKVILLEAEMGKATWMKGLILLPRLSLLQVFPLYSVYTVGIKKKNISYRANLPQAIVCDKTSGCWEPNLSRCTQTTSRLVCLTGTLAMNNTCLETLFTKTPKGCLFQRVSSDTTDVITTSGGLLLGSVHNDLYTYKGSGTDHYRYKKIPKQLFAQILNSSHGDLLSVDNSLYSLLLLGFEYNLTVYSTNVSNMVVNDSKDTYEWQYNISTNGEWNYHSSTSLYHNILIHLILLALVSIIGGLLYIKYKKPPKEHVHISSY